jgi:FKBP-type peptidyl-prolyl cis-trans isomerase FkpA
MRRHIILFTFLAIALFSCRNDGFIKNEEGLRFKYLNRGQGLVLPIEGEIVFCSYIIKNNKDSIIYSSYDNLKKEDRIPILPPSHLNGDIFSALKMMSEGDSMAFLISADSFYLKTRKETILPPEVKKGTDLTFVIKLHKIYSQAEYKEFENKEKYERWIKEVADIDSFFKMKGWQDIRLEDGVRYYIQQETNGKKAQKGQSVNFHYIGKVLKTGAEFANSYLAGSPVSFTLGDPSIRPEVLTEMLLQLKEGEKAIFLVPFDHAFGETGIANLVPPFATVIYEIHILSLK